MGRFAFACGMKWRRIMIEPVFDYKKLTVLDVSERFEEAVMTLRRLPKVKIQKHFNAWPDVVHSSAEILQMEKQPMRLPPPSAAAISRMEECMEWICWLENETERRIVWLRAERVYWKQICARLGFGRTKAWQMHITALLKIATRINTRRMRDLHVRTKNP